MNELNRLLDPAPAEDGEPSPDPAATQLELPPTILGPAAFWTPDRLVESAWLGHIPFAFWLTVALRPRVFVELGTHTGASYCAFCQAIKHASLGTLAYAVDTWEGDEHAGYYGDEVYGELAGYNRAHYGAFSQLLRSRFDDSLQYFNDSEIDLLHIDGLHTYDAVRHDFDAWLPKLSDRGVVLLHDINVRERNFGVWRLWHELAQQYPSFAFQHQHGLGIVRVGSEPAPELDRLLAAGSDPRLAAVWRNGFARLGQAIEERWAAGVQASHAAALAAERASLETRVADGEAENRRLGEERWSLEVRLADGEAENRRLGEERSSLETRLADGEAENRRLSASVEELTVTAAKLTAAQDRTRQIESDNALLADERDAIQRDLDRHKRACDSLARELGKHRRRRQKMKRSLLRRATRPLRAIIGIFFKPLRPRKIDTGPMGVVPKLAQEQVSSPPTEIATDIQAGAVASVDRTYANWVATYDTLTDTDRADIRERIRKLAHQPLISVLMPTYNSNPEHLRAAIGSVRSQLYPNWELCIADDASTNSNVRRTLEEFAEDNRINLTFRGVNGNISAASNDALLLASGEFVALMDHDDILPEHALYEVVVAINRKPDVDLIFSDEDQIDQGGQRRNAYFKPGWDPELILVHNLVSHLGVYRRSILNDLGGFRLGFEGSQDYDLALRVASQTTEDKIYHIPRILYHWRLNADHVSFSSSMPERCADAARQAITEYLTKRNEPAEVSPLPTEPLWHRARYEVSDALPMVTVIIPTRDHSELLAQCLDGLRNRTTYDRLQIIIVDNGSTEPATLQLLNSLSLDRSILVLRYPGEFNFSAMNNLAAAEAAGDILLLLNNDIEVIDAGWLREMVSHAVRPGVGAVGAKLIYPDGRVQHAGTILGAGAAEVAGHYGHLADRANPGYFHLLSVCRTVSAVTAACLAVQRTHYLEVGGMNDRELKIAFNDVDLCLRLRERGYRNIYTPFAELYHHESASRGPDSNPGAIQRFEDECSYMKRRWGNLLRQDPYYNPNFTLSSGHFELGWPPRITKVS